VPPADLRHLVTLLFVAAGPLHCAEMMGRPAVARRAWPEPTR
jgi:hypothetical protein